MAYLSTSADFIQRTYRYLREASASPTKWASAQVVDYIDEAQAAVAAGLNLFQSRWSADTAQASGLYAMSADVLAVRYVLHRPGPGDDYIRLRQASLPDFFADGRDFEASGNAKWWAMVGADAGSTGFNIQLYPAPDASAASGLLVIGTETPESISVSGTPFPRQLRPLIPLKAAILAWEDLGADSEVARYAGIFNARLKEWRVLNPDFSPDGSESRTFGVMDDDRPYLSTSIPRGTLPNPLNW